MSDKAKGGSVCALAWGPGDKSAGRDKNLSFDDFKSVQDKKEQAAAAASNAKEQKKRDDNVFYADFRQYIDRQDHHSGGSAIRRHRERQAEDSRQGGCPH